jgi:hypothetical protein
VHRQPSCEDDKGLLLFGVHMTAAARTRLVPPDVGASVLEADVSLQLGDMAGGLTQFVWAGRPMQLLG